MDGREVNATIAKARRHDHQFGLFVAVLGATGCRPSQVARCRVADLLAAENVLVVPPSKKGKNPLKPKPSQRLPLDVALTRELATWCAGKAAGALLFTLPRYVHGVGLAWIVDGERPFENDWSRAAIEASLGRRLYDLRHAAIVRMLLANVPIRLVASKLDTGVAIIERTYSKWITDPGDAFLRSALTPKRLTAVA